MWRLVYYYLQGRIASDDLMNFLKYFYNNFLMNYFQFEGVMRASLSLGSSRLLTAVIVITSLSPLNSGQSQHLQLILSSHLCLVTQ